MFNNLNNGNAGGNSWQTPYYGNVSYSNGMHTNVCRVTSLEEAIMKSNVRDSEFVYFHQTLDEFYTVRVDINGNKSWQTFSYTMPINNTVNAPAVTREEYDALVARVSALEPKEESKSV